MQNSKKIKIESGYISLTELANISPYSQEYLSLLARHGKLPAKKFGRNWYATRQAVDDYLSDQGIKIVLPKDFFNTSYKGKIRKPFNFWPKDNQPQAVLVQPQSTEEPVDLSDDSEEETIAPKIEKVLKTEGMQEGPEKKPVISPQIIKTMQKDILRIEGRPETITVPEKERIPVQEKILEKQKQAPEVLAPEIPVEERILERLLHVMESKITIPPGGITEKIAKLNGMANYYFRSTPKAITVSIMAIVVLLLLVGGVSFGNLDKTMLSVHNFFKDAVTLQGYEPGTHANEVLLLDKAGNVSIYGHIETQGQLRSWVRQGVAPITVMSATTVENLSADYLDNVSSQDFTLAFVTKNGNITYEDVFLEGNVEVGETLLVKGAAKLLDNLLVYGNLGVFGDLEISGLTKALGGLEIKGLTRALGDLEISGLTKALGDLEVDGLTRALGGIDTQGADLNLGQGTIVLANQDLIPNLNADLLDSMDAKDFNLHYVTSQGNNTFNTIMVGGLNVSGFLSNYGHFQLGGPIETGVIETGYWDIDAKGNIATVGNINADGFLNVAGVITGSSFVSGIDDSTVRKSKEYVFRGILPVSRFDIPAQTSTTTYFRISKYFAQNPMSLNPAPLPGSSRAYRLAIKYADNIATTSHSSWRIFRASSATTSDAFILQGQDLASLEQGEPYITDVLVIPDSDWQIELKLQDSANTLRVFQIFLLAFDKIN